jgi:DNA-binding NarL/FixJ family response regulator
VPANAIRAAVSVLIVDDEAHVRSYLATLLKSIGVTETWQACNGEEALEMYRAHRPTAVLLDANMPKMAGEQTLQRLQEIDVDVAVVIVTCQNDQRVVRHFSALGAIGYVLKFAPKEIVAAAIAEAIDKLIDCEQVS